MNPLFRVSALVLLSCFIAALPARAQTRAAPTHLGVGVLMSVDEKSRTLTISHQAMPSLRMTAMTMDFLVARSVRLRDVKEGDTVAFMLGRHGKSNDVAIVSLQKVDLPGKCSEPSKERK
jgi:Cu/Ag efflux protein CusF